MPLRPLWAPHTFQHLDSHRDGLVRLVLINPDRFCHHHLAKTPLTEWLPQGQAGGRNNRRVSGDQDGDLGNVGTLPVGLTDRERANSHLGSGGSSSSETLASIGPSLEERRVIRTRGVLEFMEELDSNDTCLGRANEVLLPTVFPAGKQVGTCPRWVAEGF